MSVIGKTLRMPWIPTKTEGGHTTDAFRAADRRKDAGDLRYIDGTAVHTDLFWFVNT